MIGIPTLNPEPYLELIAMLKPQTQSSEPHLEQQAQDGRCGAVDAGAARRQARHVQWLRLELQTEEEDDCQLRAAPDDGGTRGVTLQADRAVGGAKVQVAEASGADGTGLCTGLGAVRAHQARPAVGTKRGIH